MELSEVGHPDYAETRKAADQGLVDAQFKLGGMFHLGRGVIQDAVMAHMYFNIASAGGSDSARKNRDRVAEQMTREQVAEAQRLAREWMERHE
jgi:TPR repeat protein|tara:strand:- start:49 stop:327 length:279 start_codon:yes stop_codon:yes gene_type:complete